MELATQEAVTVAMRLLLSLKIASLLPQTWSPLRPTSVQDRGKILSVQISVPPPSVELLPTVMVVFSRAARSLAVKAFRKPARPLYGLTLFQTWEESGVWSAECCAAAAVAVAVTRFCCVEAQHLDDLVGHERDAVGGVACVVLIGHDPDDRAAVQAAELDLRLVCEVAQFLGHELCLLSVMV